MPTRELLIHRLEAIAATLEPNADALALLALGSAGLEIERLDEYSDLDFFVIVREGAKGAFLQTPGWLAAVHPIAFSYRNTPDGFRAMFEDGVFCELAVFEPGELAGIPFAPGRVVWRREGFDASVCVPHRSGRPSAESAEWVVGEALSALYLGLCRLRRGEGVAAFRAVQVEAAGRAMQLVRLLDGEGDGPRDPFAEERRFERRHASATAELPGFMQGYVRSAESALAILSFLERRFEVKRAMATAIRRLCGTASGG